MDGCSGMYHLLDRGRLNADMRKLELTSPTPLFLDLVVCHI